MSLIELPNDVLYEITTWLTELDITILRLTCKHLYNFIKTLTFTVLPNDLDDDRKLYYICKHNLVITLKQFIHDGKLKECNIHNAIHGAYRRDDYQMVEYFINGETFTKCDKCHYYCGLSKTNLVWNDNRNYLYGVCSSGRATYLSDWLENISYPLGLEEYILHKCICKAMLGNHHDVVDLFINKFNISDEFITECMISTKLIKGDIQYLLNYGIQNVFANKTFYQYRYRCAIGSKNVELIKLMLTNDIAVSGLLMRLLFDYAAERNRINIMKYLDDNYGLCYGDKFLSSDYAYAMCGACISNSVQPIEWLVNKYISEYGENRQLLDDLCVATMIAGVKITSKSVKKYIINFMENSPYYNIATHDIRTRLTHV